MALALGCALAGSLRADDGVLFQFNGVGAKAGSTIQDLGASSTGGGGGLAVVLGDDLWRLRCRFDGFSFPGTEGGQAVNIFTLGADAMAIFSTPEDNFRPFFSVGPGLAQWHVGQLVGVPVDKTFNKFSARVEAGVWIQERFAVYLGLFTGDAQPGRRANCPYVGLSYNPF
jgi:hypothetical protein